MAEGKPPSKRRPKSSGKLRALRKSGKTKALTSASSGLRKAAPASRKKSRSLRGSASKLKPVGERANYGGRHFRITTPIWLKFSGFTCALLAIFIIIFGVLSSNITTTEINEQINATGRKLSVFVATQIGPFWTEDSVDIEKKRKVVQAKLGEYLEKNKGDDIKEIIVYQITSTGDLRLEASATDKTQIEFRKSRTIEKGSDVTIEEGSLQGDRTRVFTADIHHKGKPVGKAQVYLKAEKINEVKSALSTNIVVICVIGILLGAIFTFLISKFLTGPIQALVEDIRAVSSGDLDHETVPRSKDEIGELAATFDEMTQQLKVAKEEELKKQAIENELEIATEIQTKLLPERLPQIPGYDMFVYYLSAKHVGGDYYDFIVVDPKHLGIVVADVSGKGVPGSMVMTMARSLIRLASRGNHSPADTMRKVNKILAQDMRRGMFVTALYMVLNVQTRELKISSAGHNPLVVYREQTQDVELIKPQGIALGFDKGNIFDANIVEESIQLYKGDRIVAYTDGVVEAMSPQDEEFGEEAFYDITRKYGSGSSKEYVNVLVQALEKHRGGGAQSDDITLSTIRVE